MVEDMDSDALEGMGLRYEQREGIKVKGGRVGSRFVQGVQGLRFDRK
jgi:hypothetical protein